MGPSTWKVEKKCAASFYHKNSELSSFGKRESRSFPQTATPSDDTA